MICFAEIRNVKRQKTMRQVKNYFTYLFFYIKRTKSYFCRYTVNKLKIKQIKL